jgi:hypothetical protein
MNITSRYADNPEVKIDPANIPAEFRHLLPLANEWSIGDDDELDQYITAATEQKRMSLLPPSVRISLVFGSGINHASI